MKVQVEFDHPIAPERAVGALTDFSERRPDLWPDLDRDAYEVHEVGDTWALVTEGSRRPKVWARERYDWSQPSRVTWTVEESNFCKPGSAVSMQVGPSEGGGSHVAIDWNRSPSGLKGTLMMIAMGVMGKRVLLGSMTRAFDNIQQVMG